MQLSTYNRVAPILFMLVTEVCFVLVDLLNFYSYSQCPYIFVILYRNLIRAYSAFPALVICIASIPDDRYFGHFFLIKAIVIFAVVHDPFRFLLIRFKALIGCFLPYFIVTAIGPICIYFLTLLF